MSERERERERERETKPGVLAPGLGTSDLEDHYIAESVNDARLNDQSLGVGSDTQIGKIGITLELSNRFADVQM